MPGFFKKAATAVHRAHVNTTKVVLRKVLPPGVGNKIIHAAQVNVDNVKSRQTCLKRDTVKYGATGLGVGATFGPQGAVIGTVAGVALGTTVALARKNKTGCLPQTVIEPEQAPAFTEAEAPMQETESVTSEVHEVEPGGTLVHVRNGGMFEELEAFFSRLLAA